MNDLEKKVDSTTDVQEACQLGYTSGYEDGYRCGIRDTLKASKVCVGCNVYVKDKYYILSATKMLKDMPPVSTKVTYCPNCWKKVCRFFENLEEA